MIKRILSLAVVMILAMALLATSASAWEWRYSHCVSNGKPLKIRSGPSKDYPVVGSVPYGEQIGVDHDLGNGWSEVIWGSVPAYAMTALMSRTYPGPYQPTKKPDVTPGPSDSSSSTTVDQMNTLVKAANFVNPYLVTAHTTRASGWVYMRWFPSRKSDAVATYPANKQLNVIAELKDWYQVEDPDTGKIGFVYKSYID